MDVRTLCLATLNLGEASGYEIKKFMDEAPFSHFQDAGFGSIYPALTRLAQEGLIEGHAQTQEKRPDKKVYRLTEAGRQQLVKSLSVIPGPDKFKSDFLFVLFMSDLLPRAHVAKVIEARLAEIEFEQAAMAACAEHITGRGSRFTFELGRTYLAMFHDFLLKNRAWLLDEEVPERTSDADAPVPRAGVRR